MGAEHADAVLDAAIRWRVALLHKPVSARTREAFEAWLGERPAHAMVWQRLQDMGARLQPGADSALPAPALAQVLRQAGVAQARGSRRKMLLSLGALGLSGGLAWRLREIPAVQRVWADHATAVGQRSRLALPDGGILHLNTDTAVDVAYDGQSRRIHLLRGEIYLQSGKDPEGRPLYVETRDGRAQALGTRYRVRQEDHATGVAVDEGVVALWPRRGNADTPAVRLTPGQQTWLTPDGVQDIAPTSRGVRDDSAWVSGQLSVRGLPLKAFLSELSRHHGAITCDPAVAALPVSGDFRLDNTGNILALLRQALPVEVTFSRNWLGAAVTHVHARRGA